jgi:hypothetical protein
MNQELLSKEQAISPNAIEEVSLELIAKMIKNHHDKVGNDQSHAFSIGKDEIEKILNQPGCSGIAFKEAITEEGVKTWIYAGVDAKGSDIIEVIAIDKSGKLDIQKGKFGIIPITCNEHPLPISLPSIW